MAERRWFRRVRKGSEASVSGMGAERRWAMSNWGVLVWEGFSFFNGWFEEGGGVPRVDPRGGIARRAFGVGGLLG
jgi:hypothetical protein